MRLLIALFLVGAVIGSPLAVAEDASGDDVDTSDSTSTTSTTTTTTNTTGPEPTGCRPYCAE